MVNEWTRDDLPGIHSPGIHGHEGRQGADAALDAVVAHLNERHPKPCANRVLAAGQSPAWVFRALEDDHQQALAKVERERDAAVARADQLRDERDDAVQSCMAVGRERDEWKSRAEDAEKRHTWPKMTPTGHTYIEPHTYASLCHEHGNAAQAAVESWEVDECPPEPTWEMVGIAHREVGRLQCERDEAVARAEAAEARTAPTVTRKLVYDAVGAVYDVNGRRGPWPGVEPITDAVCHLFGIETAPDPVETLAAQIEDATRRAVRQACETLAPVAAGLNPEVIEEMMDITEASRRLARHVLGQEAKR